MLGYVRTDTQELRVREYQYYRALYCGLCKRMGKCTGNCSRLSLSYDFVFLAAIRLSLTGEAPRIQAQRCFLHPLKKRPTAQQCDALDYCADASALLTYHKLADDRQDEHGLKKLRAVCLSPLFKRAYKKAKKRHPELDRQIQSSLSALSAYENREVTFFGADALAEQFGLLMQAVFSEGLAGKEARIAGAIGRAVGHWIYLADAADDFEEDRKKGRFNPYLLLFGDTLTDQDRETLRLGMTAQLCEAERAFLLIDQYPTAELKEILHNILDLGLPAATQRTTARKACRKKCKKRKGQ